MTNTIALLLISTASQTVRGSTKDWVLSQHSDATCGGTETKITMTITTADANSCSKCWPTKSGTDDKEASYCRNADGSGVMKLFKDGEDCSGTAESELKFSKNEIEAILDKTCAAVGTKSYKSDGNDPVACECGKTTAYAAKTKDMLMKYYKAKDCDGTATAEWTIKTDGEDTCNSGKLDCMYVNDKNDNNQYMTYCRDKNGHGQITLYAKTDPTCTGKAEDPEKLEYGKYASGFETGKCTPQDDAAWKIENLPTSCFCDGNGPWKIAVINASPGPTIHGSTLALVAAVLAAIAGPSRV